MKTLAARLDAAVKAAGVPILSVSVGSEQDRTTWLVEPRALQGQAQPILDAFVMPSADQLLDEQAISDADQRILRAIVVELHAAIPAWAGKPTLVQLRNNIITRWKALS